jgi:hypothetical protein
VSREEIRSMLSLLTVVISHGYQKLRLITSQKQDR